MSYVPRSLLVSGRAELGPRQLARRPRLKITGLHCRWKKREGFLEQLQFRKRNKNKNQNKEHKTEWYFQFLEGG